MKSLVRRFIAVALLTLPFQGTAVALAALGEEGHGHCNDHVCACKHHCATKKAAPAKRSCHEPAPPANAWVARCGAHNETAPLPTVSTAPHVPTAAFLLTVAPGDSALAGPESDSPLVGVDRVALPPPKSLL